MVEETLKELKEIMEWTRSMCLEESNQSIGSEMLSEFKDLYEDCETQLLQLSRRAHKLRRRALIPLDKHKGACSIPLPPLAPPCRPIIDGANMTHPMMVEYRHKKAQIYAENKRRGYMGQERD